MLHPHRLLVKPEKWWSNSFSRKFRFGTKQLILKNSFLLPLRTMIFQSIMTWALNTLKWPTKYENWKNFQIMIPRFFSFKELTKQNSYFKVVFFVFSVLERIYFLDYTISKSKTVCNLKCLRTILFIVVVNFISYSCKIL